MNLFYQRPRQGSALVLCLCAIAILSITVLGLVEFADLDMQELALKEKDFRARQLAESGIAIGLFPEMEKDDPVLHQEINSTESFDVKLESEGSRLNINAILLQKQEDVLKNLLKNWGVKTQEQSVIVDSLMDWVDADPLQRLNGAEEKVYQAKGMIGFPPNRPFQDLDEMDLVNGIELLTKVKPDWKNSFTLWSDGKLDVNEAPPELIAAACGVGTREAENFAKRRAGQDGKADTADDFKYKDMGEVRNALGMSEKAFAAVEKRLTLKSEYRRIESTGRIGSYERKLAVVVRLNVAPAQYLTWIEF